MNFTYDDADDFREIFKQHGWPSEHYRKDECMEAIRKHVYGDED